MTHPRFDLLRRCRPISEWPNPDRAAWEAATTKGDPFSNSGPAADWRQSTKRLVSSHYGRWLTFLASQDSLVADQQPGDRVTREQIVGYIDELRTTCLDTTLTLRIEGLVRALRVMQPDFDLTWLRTIVRSLKAQSKTHRDKESRIRSSRELVELGFQLMAKAERSNIDRTRRAVRFRDGLIIALLAVRPLRLNTFASIRIGEELLKTSDGYNICIPAENTKTGQPIELPFPPNLVVHLGQYLDIYRPDLLRGRVTNHLWINQYGDPMGPNAVSVRCRKMTNLAFGIPINPHLFRDCAATTIAIEDPDHIRMAAALLGHRSLETTNRYYNQAKMIDACRSFGATIVELRSEPNRDGFTKSHGR